MKTKDNLTKKQVKAADKYPGVAINIADSDKVSSKLVKERVKAQNNNPRNNDD
ncbi:MAG: hypothetical protein J1F20_02940 [Muribaculaceae bacterium]|nr:hypothetical protein [Muribaculaceae bacterium]